MRAPVPPPLKRFIWDIQSMVELAESEREILVIGRDLMARLVASDDWLPEDFAVPDETQYQQYLLYGDGLERFSVVSTVFHGGQAMPVCQDRVWEIRGLLRGSMGAQHFLWEPGSAPRPKGDASSNPVRSMLSRPKMGKPCNCPTLSPRAFPSAFMSMGETSARSFVMRSMPMVRHALLSPIMRTLSLRPLMISGRSKPKYVIDHAVLKESKQHLSEKQH
jgi:predicted metal-dependent enzyme (double-stranded beta helix superfamily)